LPWPPDGSQRVEQPLGLRLSNASADPDVTGIVPVPTLLLEIPRIDQPRLAT
jgi:hypothetical protein